MRVYPAPLLKIEEADQSNNFRLHCPSGHSSHPTFYRYILDPLPHNLTPKHRTRNPKPQTINLLLHTLTLNLNSQTLNPKFSMQEEARIQLPRVRRPHLQGPTLAHFCSQLIFLLPAFVPSLFPCCQVTRWHVLLVLLADAFCSETVDFGFPMPAPGPSWGYFKNRLLILSTFGEKCTRNRANGSKN